MTGEGRKPEHAAVPRRYGIACYCGAKFDETHGLEDHLYAAQADDLAGRLAQRMVSATHQEGRGVAVPAPADAERVSEVVQARLRVLGWLFWIAAFVAVGYFIVR